MLGILALALVLAYVAARVGAPYPAFLALVGAGLVTSGELAGLPYAITAPLGAVLATALRLVALRRGWNLPNASPE